ncbi:MAG: alpha/beta hydrolase, partial [Anaerolineae bacterium]|nr:alpha/beta hydrolase [Anaerolineae bacterium]
MPFLEFNGAKLHYETKGSGPAVVFVHAGIADSRM